MLDAEKVPPPDELEEELWDYPEASEEEETEGAEQEEFAVALFAGKTGTEYHLAAMHCISLRLRRDDGQWFRDTVEYEIKDEDGEAVTQGTATDGIIFHDGVAMGDYDLIIDDATYDITSTPHASEYDYVFLAAEDDEEQAS